MRRQREWDGISNWSSHPCRNPAALNRQAFTEILALMHWDARLVKAFRRAHDEYIAAGSPGVPMLAENYRKTFLSPSTEKPND